MKISACMIVRNEEKTIARCINSFRDVVYETIVVDTGSADQTIKIAKDLKAKVFHFAWINNFAAAKNYAISRAKGDWIIFLDADEYFAEGIAQNIPKLINNIDKSYNAIASKMINIEASNGQYFDELIHIRIFKNKTNIRYVNAIHETLINIKNKLSVFFADKEKILIYHTGYSQINKRSKAERNHELLIQELANAAQRPEIYHYLSDSYYALEDWKKAIQYAKLFLDSGVALFGRNTKSHQNIITAMFQLPHSTTDDIMREIEIAMVRFPDNPIFFYYKASLLYKNRKYNDAFMAYENVLRLQKDYNDIEINSMSQFMHHVYFYMGVISEHRNADEQAMDFYLESLKHEKRNADCFQRLFMLVRDQPPQDIILFLNTLYIKEDQDDLEFLVAQLTNCEAVTVFSYYTNLRLQKFEKYDIILLQMLLANGCYEETFQNLLDCYVQRQDSGYAVLTAIAALLGNNPDHRVICYEQLPSSVIKIMQTYRHNDTTLNSEDQKYYCQIVDKFILWADDESLERLVSLSSHFENDVSDNVGTIFLNRRYYQAALRFYDRAINNGSNSDKLASCYFHKGYCLYKLKDYATAVENFLQAYRCGYRENDIYELLRCSIRDEQDREAVMDSLSENWRFVQDANCF